VSYLFIPSLSPFRSRTSAILAKSQSAKNCIFTKTVLKYEGEIKTSPRSGVVAHFYNSSYSGSRDLEDYYSNGFE
jgi:hypothetical protein